MKPSSPNHSGHPVISAAVVGSCSLALALVLQVAGTYLEAHTVLWQTYRAHGFQVGEGPGQLRGELLWIGVLVYGLAWILFEIPGWQRRLLILVSALVLVGTFSLVLALWGVFWSPLAALVAMIWSGSCAILWSSQHPMPCERGAIHRTGNEKIIPLERGEKEKPRRKQS